MTDILLNALLLSLVLLGIHAYFGLEIIRRGIIFTDLAIGQMAALGITVAVILNLEARAYGFAVLFALITAILIALVSRGLGKESNRLEAFIGLLYVLGISGSYVILSKVAHGMEIFQRLIASDILYSSFRDTLELSIIYSLVGVVVFFNDTRLKGLKRDLVFFVAFAITVTSSVKMAGVMVVFVMLVAPAMVSLSLHSKNNLLIAWLIGTFTNSIAILLSYHYDLPTGYTIVFCNSLFAGCAVVYRAIRPGAHMFRNTNYTN